MGQFEQERNMLKKYARIGQFFSVSKEICTLDQDQIKRGMIDDIERNGYNFTDGVGSISPKLAVEISKKFG